MRKLLFIMLIMIVSCTEDKPECECIATNYSASRTTQTTYTYCHNGTTYTTTDPDEYKKHREHGDSDGECTLSDNSLSENQSFYSNNCSDNGKVLRNKNNSVTGIVNCN